MRFKHLLRTTLLRPTLLTATLMLLAACTPIRQTGSVPIYTSSPTIVVRPDTTPTLERAPLDENEPGVSAEDSYTIAPATAAAKPAQKAVKSLIDEAWVHYHNDNPGKAIAVAERAQRLDTRSGEVYLVLASSYFIQGKQQLAEQFARRGISYSVVGSALRNRLQQLLGQITAG